MTRDQLASLSRPELFAYFCEYAGYHEDAPVHKYAIRFGNGGNSLTDADTKDLWLKFSGEVEKHRRRMKKPVKVPIKSRKMLPRYSAEEMAVLAERVGLTAEQLKKAGDMTYAVYQEIGADLAAANNGKSMKREDIVEVCMDAGRPVAGWSGGKIDPELKKWFLEKSMKYKLDDVYAAIAAASFPYPEYE